MFMRRSVSRWLRSAIVVAALLLAVGGSLATCYSAGIAGHHSCPHCSHPCKICEPQPTTDKEKKHCWCVELKEVCIPHIRWPWQPCCEPPKCGRVRTVKVLKKVEYECEKCGYKWEIKCLGCCPE